MHHTLLAVAQLLVVCSWGFAQGAQTTPKGADSDRLQGLWIADLAPGLQGRIEFEGDQLRFAHIHQDDHKRVIWDGYFALNEQADPQQMDWLPRKGSQPKSGGKSVPVNRAIYQLQGELLLIIGSTQGGRPTAFYSGGGEQRPKTIIFRRAPDRPDPVAIPLNLGSVPLSPTPTGR
ncbi:hypothetical protein [Rosistilla ulvae]|nr:hypothetical protein [Rosistilla ulvae]